MAKMNEKEAGFFVSFGGGTIGRPIAYKSR